MLQIGIKSRQNKLHHGVGDVLYTHINNRRRQNELVAEQNLYRRHTVEELSNSFTICTQTVNNAFRLGLTVTSPAM